MGNKKLTQKDEENIFFERLKGKKLSDIQAQYPLVVVSTIQRVVKKTELKFGANVTNLCINNVFKYLKTVCDNLTVATNLLSQIPLDEPVAVHRVQREHLDEQIKIIQEYLHNFQKVSNTKIQEITERDHTEKKAETKSCEKETTSEK